MVAFSVAAISLIIAVIDIREHRIRNFHILIFSIPLSIKSSRVPLAESLIIVVAALLICIVFNIGGGDFKLFAMLVAAQGSLIVSFAYFSRFLVSTSLSLLLSLLLQGGLRGSVPLAPAILAPFLYLYLGI